MQVGRRVSPHADHDPMCVPPPPIRVLVSPRGTFYQGYRCSRCRAPAHKECLGRLGTCGRSGAGERHRGLVGERGTGSGASWHGGAGHWGGGGVGHRGVQGS